MRYKLGLFLLLIASFYTSADWLDVNMPVGVTDISKEVFDLHMAIFFVTVAIGVIVFGDPHVDDDGCDWPALLRDVELSLIHI